MSGEERWDPVLYTSRFSNQLYRELLAVDNFFDNFPKKTPIARALIYSIKVGGRQRSFSKADS